MPGKFPLVNCFPSPKRNSLIALRPASAATVVTKPSPSTGTRPTSPCLSPPTPTNPLLALANTTSPTPTLTSRSLVPSRLEQTQSLLSRTPSPCNPSLSPSRLTLWSSSHTPPVFSTPLLAVPPSITPSSLLVTVLRTVWTTGSLRTPGVPHGVIKVTSNSPLSMVRVSAVSRWPPSTPASDRFSSVSNYYFDE